MKDQEKVAFGGSSSYCSLTAARLGWETHVLSKGNSELDNWIKYLESEGITVGLQESKSITHNLNEYVGEKRKEWNLGDAGKINHKQIKKADIIHLGPVFNETSLECVKEARKNSKLLSFDVQGLLRKSKNKEIIKRFWRERDEFLKHIDLLKISEDEVPFVSKNNKRHPFHRFLPRTLRTPLPA